MVKMTFKLDNIKLEGSNSKQEIIRNYVLENMEETYEAKCLLNIRKCGCQEKTPRYKPTGKDGGYNKCWSHDPSDNYPVGG